MGAERSWYAEQDVEGSAQAVEVLYQIKQDILEEMIPGAMTAESMEAIFRQIKKALLERALNSELAHHLGRKYAELTF